VYSIGNQTCDAYIIDHHTPVVYNNVRLMVNTVNNECLMFNTVN
jgi:hypothetical protein